MRSNTLQARESILSKFRPDFTADEMEELGVLRTQYPHQKSDYQNYFGVDASLNTWPKKWIDKETAPEGWYQWYKGYSNGVRTEDDERQMRRWVNYKNRHLGSLKKADPTLRDTSIQPRRRQALLNWGIDSGVDPERVKELRLKAINNKK